MGYTHYWGKCRFKKRTEWLELMKMTEVIVARVQELGIPLCYEMDEPDKPPQIDKEMIRFNGAGDDGYETFILEPTIAKDDEWFCKTNRNDYDKAVVWVLEAARYVTDGRFKWTSDGLGEEQFHQTIQEFYDLFKLTAPKDRVEPAVS